METHAVSVHSEPYRRVPMNSATTQRDCNDFHSIGTHSTYSIWSRPTKRTLTTTYIDGTTMLNQYDRPYDIKNLFPKGKNRQKPPPTVEKKNARHAYMSLLPADTSTIRSPLPTITRAQTSALPEVLLPKTPSSRNNRSAGRTIFDDDSQSKLYARSATTHANNAWTPTVTRDLPQSTGTSNRTQIHEESYAVEEEEYDDSDLTGRLIAESYRILSKLGAGSFGQVYLCENIHSNEQWAIKIESIHPNSRPILSSEYKIYRIFEHALGFPKVDYFNSEPSFNILVMELLGPSLEDLFNYCHRKFTLKTALMLVDQMISRIEYVHTCHLVHRDIKPDNFLMGMKSSGNTVYIIDFGLSKRYRDPKTLLHISMKSNRTLTGTARYASINAHKGAEQSRRDDLEAISYVFMYFLLGTLPWQGLQATGRKAKFERIAEMKMKLTAEQICKNQPKECSVFVNYCRTLGFDHRPNYDYLRDLFRHLLYQKNEQYDYDYDWIVDYRSKHWENSPEISD